MSRRYGRADRPAMAMRGYPGLADRHRPAYGACVTRPASRLRSPTLRVLRFGKRGVVRRVEPGREAVDRFARARHLGVLLAHRHDAIPEGTHLVTGDPGVTKDGPQVIGLVGRD